MTRDLADVRYFLLDLDGTIYLGPECIAGAPDFIARLRETGRRFLFLTNNPSSDAARYAAKLSAIGIPTRSEEILTAGAATAQHIAENTPWRRVYALGTPTFEEELRRAGIEPLAEDPEAVVLAFDKTLTYAKLERACLLLAKGLPYLATNPDKVCPTEYGYIPDCGAMAALIAEATGGRQPHYIGKPSPDFARLAMHRLGAEAGATAMVGDRLYTDMEMARLSGIGGILVLSGESTREDVANAPWRPDWIFPSVAELAEAL